MQAILCDLCEQRIRDVATELQIIRGEAASTDDGKPRIAQRGAVKMLFLCGPCSRWFDSALEVLRTPPQSRQQLEIRASSP